LIKDESQVLVGLHGMYGEGTLVQAEVRRVRKKKKGQTKLVQQLIGSVSYHRKKTDSR